MHVRALLPGLLSVVFVPLSVPGVQFPSIQLEVVATNVTRPVYVTHADDGSERVFIVEQPGRIRVISDGVLQGEPFLDIDARVAGGEGGADERGLLGLAFPPGFVSKQYFYVHYFSSPPDEMILSRFRVSTNDMNQANQNSEEVILRIPQPETNHNGGQANFGKDGYLYLGPGDGGGFNDLHGTNGNAQKRDTLLGKILRIDVETPPTTNGYQIPPNNPFVLNTNTFDEIWALGLRNPYRFSFDRDTGDLYIGDVGQFVDEEIDYQPASSTGGENYGWRRYEATRCTMIQGDSCETKGLTFPVFEYPHTGGRQAVVGGFVDRGSETWSLMYGIYFFADYNTGEIMGLKREGTNWVDTVFTNEPYAISGFGEDEPGNIYVCDLLGGAVRRIVEVFADNDNDQMPDPYEAYYGFDTNNPADAAEDGDGDTSSNLDEFLAGTNPTNANSVLRIESLSVVGMNSVAIAWSSASNRLYRLSAGSNLVDVPVPVVSNILATPPMNVHTDAVFQAGPRFYDVGVE
jgi:hypothetical protein